VKPFKNSLANDPPLTRMIQDTIPAECRTLVLFGATGDLARRMLWPSLYALDRDGLLPAGYRLIGAAHSQWSDEAFIAKVRDAIQTSANARLFDDAAFAAFAARIRYVSVDAEAASGLDALGTLGTALGDRMDGGVIYYLSTAPQLFGPICVALRERALVNDKCRVVVEKPIGTDSASAHDTNEAIATAFNENLVFRIDHYLGKEAVQNLLALRFANAIFEPLWNANAIEQVQITVAETVGVEGRWAFYNSTGALRDMVQSHLLQLLCLVAMEPPASFTPSAVRNEKVKVLWSLRPITGADVAHHTVTGQYTAGFSGGQAAVAYNEEAGAEKTSDIETFVALRVEIDNWRWAGVPFYLRTGKRMPTRSSEIVIQFKPAPYNIFAQHAVDQAAAGRNDHPHADAQATRPQRCTARQRRPQSHTGRCLHPSTPPHRLRAHAARRAARQLRTVRTARRGGGRMEMDRRHHRRLAQHRAETQTLRRRQLGAQRRDRLAGTIRAFVARVIDREATTASHRLKQTESGTVRHLAHPIAKGIARVARSADAAHHTIVIRRS
jgi:glucose-6-phosphate 1-dehydrogenase